MTFAYRLTVRAEHPIPHDVLVEHIAVSLRDFRFAGKTDVSIDSVQPGAEVDEQMTRQHPFDGPEMFDDSPRPIPAKHGSAGEPTALVNLMDSFPYVNVIEAAMQLKEARNAQP